MKLTICLTVVLSLTIGALATPQAFDHLKRGIESNIKRTMRSLQDDIYQIPIQALQPAIGGQFLQPYGLGLNPGMSSYAPSPMIPGVPVLGGYPFGQPPVYGAGSYYDAQPWSPRPERSPWYTKESAVSPYDSYEKAFRQILRKFH